MVRNDYEFKAWDQWPHRLKNWLKGINQSKFVTLTGKGASDGTVFPDNGPVLWKKERIQKDHTATTPVDYVTLNEWLGISPSELKNYMIVANFGHHTGGVSSITDQITVDLEDGATTSDQVYTIEEVGIISAEGRSTGVSVEWFPDATYRIVRLAADSWTTGTERYAIILRAYRMPDGICD